MYKIIWFQILYTIIASVEPLKYNYYSTSDKKLKVYSTKWPQLLV